MKIRAPSSRALGWVILALVVVSLAMSMWTSYSQAQRAQCQAELNQRFLEALKTNTALAEDDRDNLARTIEDVATALEDADSPSEIRGILDEYQQRRAEIDANREEYPPLPEKACE